MEGAPPGQTYATAWYEWTAPASGELQVSVQRAVVNPYIYLSAFSAPSGVQANYGNMSAIGDGRGTAPGAAFSVTLGQRLLFRVADGSAAGPFRLITALNTSADVAGLKLLCVDAATNQTFNGRAGLTGVNPSFIYYPIGRPGSRTRSPG